LLDNRGQRLWPFRPGIGGEPVPIEQKAQEITRRHRLDLGAQGFNGVAMDAREQAPLAPFGLFGVRGKLPAQDKAFGFQRHQRRVDRARADA